jgi:hypothetical protein
MRVAQGVARLLQVRVAPRKRGYNAGPVDVAMNLRTADALPVFQRREGRLDSRSWSSVWSSAASLIMLAV